MGVYLIHAKALFGNNSTTAGGHVTVYLSPSGHATLVGPADSGALTVFATRHSSVPGSYNTSIGGRGSVSPVGILTVTANGAGITMSGFVHDNSGPSIQLFDRKIIATKIEGVDLTH